MLYNHNMRIFLLIIDGLGVGSQPDYSKYDSEYNCTLDNISVIDESSTLNKLGLLKCCLKENNLVTKSRYYRGRMLTIFNDFEYGLTEILGNCVFDKSLPIKENLITMLKKYNVNYQFVTSRSECGVEGNIVDCDYSVFYYIKSFLDNNDGVFIGEFNDFAKAGLIGDTQKMNESLSLFDKNLGEIVKELKYNDILVVSGNFGINPSKIGITREYIPILLYSKLLGGSKVLETIQGNNCIAMTIVDLLNIYPNINSLISEKEKQKIESYSNILKNDLIASGFEKVLEIKGKDKSKQVSNKKVARENKIKTKKAVPIKK